VLLPSSAAAQWIEQNAGFSQPGLEVFSLDAVDANVVWALAGDWQGGYFPNQEFTRTTDGGAIWVPVVVPGAADFTGNCITAVDASTAWAAMGDPSLVLGTAIFKTTDGGGTWVRQSTAFPQPGRSWCRRRRPARRLLRDLRDHRWRQWLDPHSPGEHPGASADRVRTHPGAELLRAWGHDLVRHLCR